MEKINCEVVKDLLPLYIDGICSESSAKIIEEHIRICDPCLKTLRDMRDVGLSADNINKSQVDYMKGIRRYIKGRQLGGLIIFALVCVIVLFLLFHVQDINAIWPPYLIAPCMIAALCTCGENSAKEKADRLCGIAMLCISAYYIILSVYMAICSANPDLSGTAIEKSGPVVAVQYGLIAFLSFASIVFCAARGIAKGKANMYCVSAAAVIFNAALSSLILLHRLDTVDTILTQIGISAAVYGAELLAAELFFYIIFHIKVKKFEY